MKLADLPSGSRHTSLIHPSWVSSRAVSVGPGPGDKRWRRGDAFIGADGEESLSAFWLSGIGHGDGTGGGRGYKNALVAYGLGAGHTRLWWEIGRLILYSSYTRAS